MKWVRHHTNSNLNDPVINRIKSSEFGIKGYAYYFILIEIIAGYMEGKDDDPTVEINDFTLSSHMRCKRKVLIKFLGFLQDIGEIKYRTDEKMITITMPMLSKLLDKNAISSSFRKKSGAPREEKNRLDNILSDKEVFYDPSPWMSNFWALIQSDNPNVEGPKYVDMFLKFMNCLGGLDDLCNAQQDYAKYLEARSIDDPQTIKPMKFLRNYLGWHNMNVESGEGLWKPFKLEEDYIEWT